MVRADRVRDELGLAEPARDVGADHGVAALDLVGQRLADVVHQRRAARELLVEAELGGHHAGEEARLDRVQPLVLRVARAEVERADQLDDLGMRLLDAERLERLLAERADLLVEVLAALVAHSSGSLRASSIVSGFLIMRCDRAPHELAADAVEAVEPDRILVVVDLQLDAGDLLERAVQRAAVVEQDADQLGADAQRRHGCARSGSDGGSASAAISITRLRLAVVRRIGGGLLGGADLRRGTRARILAASRCSSCSISSMAAMPARVSSSCAPRLALALDVVLEPFARSRRDWSSVVIRVELGLALLDRVVECIEPASRSRRASSRALRLRLGLGELGVARPAASSASARAAVSIACGAPRPRARAALISAAACARASSIAALALRTASALAAARGDHGGRDERDETGHTTSSMDRPTDLSFGAARGRRVARCGAPRCPCAGLGAATTGAFSSGIVDDRVAGHDERRASSCDSRRAAARTSSGRSARPAA